MNQEQSKALGGLLRHKRQELGYSMNQLAHAAGVPASTVLRFERGEFGAPRPDKLARFASLLGIGLADLFANAGYLVPDEMPSFDFYLSAKYPDLSEEDRVELARHFNDLANPNTVSAQPFSAQEPIDESAGTAS